jgi:sugar (pentulose or hexulose) kinase
VRRNCSRAEDSGAGSGGEIFLPYLSGERTPHNDARVRGAFLNLDHDTDLGRLAQAVLEGVAFALADGLDALRDAGTNVTQLSVIGGGARSGYWGRIIAAAFEAPLVYLKGGEVGPALGVARLAQSAVDKVDDASICVPPPLPGTLNQNDRSLKCLHRAKRSSATPTRVLLTRKAHDVRQRLLRRLSRDRLRVTGERQRARISLL